MPTTPDTLAAHFDRRLAALREGHGRPARIIVAFSGGRDSTVLLDLAARSAAARGTELVAAHVNHGLDPRADDWQAHCERIAAAEGVTCRSLVVEVKATGGAGLEANARTARYRALAELLREGDWLLTAHHRDDQAETVLLNLMRGSGAAGVRGAAMSRPLGAGLLLRPLLDVRAADIAFYAGERQLDWIEDPSNADTRRDRNFLRRDVLPLLIERWPQATGQLARSAALAAESAELAEALAAADLATAGDDGRLRLEALAALSEARVRNLLRHACTALRLPPPPSRQLRALLDELLPARGDAEPLIRWPGAEARRYRGHLYLLPEQQAPQPPPAERLTAAGRLTLGAAAGQLALEPSAAGGIAQATGEDGLEVRYREGGETLRPAGSARRRALKKLLQEAGVVPWMRTRIPLLYAEDSLVAVGDLWVADEHYDAAGFAVRWRGRPPLY